MDLNRLDPDLLDAPHDGLLRPLDADDGGVILGGDDLFAGADLQNQGGKPQTWYNELLPVRRRSHSHLGQMVVATPLVCIAPGTGLP